MSGPNIDPEVKKQVYTIMAKAYFTRFFLPLICFAPLLIIGFSVPGFIATMIVYMFMRRQIEHHYHVYFALLYVERSQNLEKKSG